MIYSKNFPYRLEHIKQACVDNIQDIVLYPGAFFDLHNGEPISEICVRYVYDEGKFGYAYMGDFFFLDDCMYVISNDEKFKTFHNDDIPEILNDWYGVEWGRNDEYVFRAIFAGVQTPYKDNCGDWIFTGDIVKANDYLISGICAFPPLNEDEECISPAQYGLMCDNHMLSLNVCKKLERLGTIYFRIDKDETEISLETEIGGRVQRLGFDEDYLLCARYTPSYHHELWQYKALETLEIEYNWRKKI